VTPPWLAGAGPDDRTIVIDPGMAFGTGDHPTTRGVIRLMTDVIREGDLVADLGAGSAVLAIAAARLGARRVVAIELDADAIGNAEENVARNGVADRVTVLEGDAEVLLPLIAPVRVMLVNIISSVIVRLLPVIAASLADDGMVIFSGMLTTERDAMVDVLQQRKWMVVREDIEGEWWSAVARRT
jgi:ribosomal protein L11 methyltransferase